MHSNFSDLVVNIYSKALQNSESNANHYFASWYSQEIVRRYVTGFEKTLHMGFFQKIEFDAWLISSTIELTRIQVLS